MRWIETCECKAAMRGRWTRDRWPRAYVCTRCKKPVSGYEGLWVNRMREMERAQKE